MNLTKRSISYKIGELIYQAELHLTTNSQCILSVDIFGKGVLTACGSDFFECFRSLRELDKSIIYYCKGAKINVIASRMTRQMTKGLSAYQTTLGEQARKKDLVNIFDYEDQGLAVDPSQQDNYQEEWFLSLNN